MQGCVDPLPCPPERTEATFCRVSGGDSDAWRPHPKAPAGPGSASETGGRPARHRQHHGHTIGNRVTSALDFGVSQPSDCSWATCRFWTPGRWQTSSRSTNLFAASRTRRPLGTLGSTPSTLAKWERGERVPAGGGRSGRSRMVGGAVPPTLSRRFAQLRPHFRRIRGAISTC